MTRRCTLWVGATFLSLLVALGAAQAQLDRIAAAQTTGTVEAPRFEVDPFWPKPLPNHWVLGNAIGVWVDATDTVWIVHRGSGDARRQREGAGAEAGRLLRRRAADPRLRQGGQPGPPLGRSRRRATTGPLEPRHLHRSHRHGLDRRQRPRRLADHEIHQGRQVRRAVRQAERARVRQERQRREHLQAAAAAIRSNFGRVAKIFVDPKANEAYIADGYFNRRVAVLDAATGSMKRFWGAYGKKPDDESPARRLRSRRAAASALPQPGALRRRLERRLRLRLRPRQRSPPGVQAGRHVREGSVPRQEHRRRVRCGTSPSPRIRSSASCSSPTA